MKDLFFKQGEKAFSLRVSAVVIAGDFVLMQYNGNKNKLMFSGGHLKHGENSADALLRELKEECTLKLEIKRFLGWHEFCFDWEGMHTHQVCAFYEMSAPNMQTQNINLKLTDELTDFCYSSKLIWVKKSELLHNTVYPTHVLESLNLLLDKKLLN